MQASKYGCNQPLPGHPRNHSGSNSTVHLLSPKWPQRLMRRAADTCTWESGLLRILHHSKLRSGFSVYVCGAHECCLYSRGHVNQAPVWTLTSMDEVCYVDRPGFSLDFGTQLCLPDRPGLPFWLPSWCHLLQLDRPWQCDLIADTSPCGCSL